MQAAEDGNVDKLKHLLSQDPKLVNCSDKDGYTPLHRACYSNQPEVVDLLLSLGADVGAKTELQWQPLHSCCQWNNKDCAVRLIQHGADVNACSEGGNYYVQSDHNISLLPNYRAINKNKVSHLKIS